MRGRQAFGLIADVRRRLAGLSGDSVTVIGTNSVDAAFQPGMSVTERRVAREAKNPPNAFDSVSVIRATSGNGHFELRYFKPSGTDENAPERPKAATLQIIRKARPNGPRIYDVTDVLTLQTHFTGDPNLTGSAEEPGNRTFLGGYIEHTATSGSHPVTTRDSVETVLEALADLPKQ